MQHLEDKKEAAPQLDRREKQRWARIKRVYGLTKEQYDELDLGHCPVCLRTWSESVKPVVDHDHVSGHVRGILCAYCNHRIVGRHRDGELIRRVADYLLNYRKNHIVPKRKKKRRKAAKKRK